MILSSANAQNEVQAEDKYNLYWQPDVEIDYSHFQAESDADCIKFNEKFELKNVCQHSTQWHRRFSDKPLKKKDKKEVGK